ncbi:MAG: hypothetical protein QOI03_1874 [Solirubrobacteraceae bacterium]|nr:hypothetical protein [Solirubrobacteraceae bacterium]
MSTQSSAGQLDAKALARARRAAIRARARRIRRTVAGFSAALFSAAFLGIYVQLATGHDPALSRTAATATQVSGSSATKSASSAKSPSSESSSAAKSSSSESSSAAETPSGESSAGSEESSGVSAVTTKQS